MNHGKTLKAILRCLCAGFLAIAANAHAETIVRQSINVKEAGEYDLRVRTKVNEPGVLRLTIEKPGVDGDEIDFNRVDVIVDPGANTAPNAVEDAYGTDEDTVKSANVLANDSDADNDPLTVTAINGQTANVGGATTLSSGAKLTLNADGTFSYDPNGAFENLNTGEEATDNFSYTIADGNGGTDTAAVTMTIDGVADPSANTAPNAVDDIRRTDEDTVKSAGVLWNDSDADNDPLTVTAVNGQTANVGTTIALSSGAKLTLNADGTFSYDPNGAFESLNTGEKTTDNFSYTIADGNGGTGTAAVTMIVDGVTDPFRTQGRQLIGPDGKPMALKGYRVGIEEVSSGFASEARFEALTTAGIGGNAQAFEIWWTRNKGPSEPQPSKVGVYNKNQLEMYLAAMRSAVRAGMYIIPSIRVSFNREVAEDGLKNDKTSWQGWAPHDYVLYNRADPYGGRGRDRFFAWLDWLVPAILADKEIADKIAYWEMWHLPGHQHRLPENDWDQFIDDFVPRLIAKFREHEPERLLGVSLRNQRSMSRVLSRNVTFDDHNLIYVVGGYCHHDTLMEKGPDKVFPTGCYAPNYANGEFDFVAYAREHNIALHSQEGPGLKDWNHANPISAKKRDMLVGLFRLYNAEANGWAWHGPAPDTILKSDAELTTIVRKAFDGSL